MQVNGSTALVTGASKRIGRAIALSLAENGCNVAVHYFNSHEEAVETCETIRSLGVKSQPVQADLTKSGDCAGLWTKAIDALDAIPNILINNASSFGHTTLDETTGNDFDDAMAVKVRAPMLLAQMMARDLPETTNGKIVNINDRRKVYKSRFAFGIANAAMSGLTRSLAAALAPQIQVNELRLGPILPLSDNQAPGTSRMSLDTLGPAGRMGELDEVCRAALSLIENDYINGGSLIVDGGLNVLNR